MNIATNVTAGKPKIGGAVFRAPLGTKLPTNPTSELDEAFESIGYCSDDGVTNSNTRESEEIKAWGGDTVLTIQTSKDDKFTMTWIETMNVATLKAVHGDANVNGDLASGITITVNSKELTAGAYVIDMALRDNAIKRIVIPNAAVSEVDDVVYSDEEVVGYPVTLTCMPDEAGNTHYEYIIREGATPAPSIDLPTVTPIAGDVVVFGTPVSDIQEGITISDGKITGTLHYLDTGALVDRWGAGNFLAIQFADIAEGATSLQAGMDPSQGGGLVELIDDPDKNGVWKVTDKTAQVFKYVITDGTNTETRSFDLSGLTVESA